MVWSDEEQEKEGPKGASRAGVAGRVSTGAPNIIGAVNLTARGTQNGLILRASGSASQEAIWDALRGFIQSRRSFVEGNQVIIEWAGDTSPSEDTVSFVRANVLREFDIDLMDGGRVSGGSDEVDVQVGSRAGISLTEEHHSGQHHSGQHHPGPSLFGGLEAALGGDSRKSSSSRGSDEKSRSELSSGARLGATPKVGWGAAIANWDDADARVVYGTLRSGQKVETEHSLVIFGDVNSGAEIVAGGDVIVLGNLRGVAHAGAYDETGGGRVIFALHLEPTQLRIGAVISRGMGGGSTPEIARVDGQSIVVEPYQAKGAPSGRKAA